jgi:ribosomal protein S12 methylthiotransferase accessory factor
MQAVALRASLAARFLPGGGVILAGESDRFLITDPLECALLKAAASGADHEMLVRALGDSYSKDDIAAAFARLETGGILVSRNEGLHRAEAAYWEQLGVGAAEAESRIRHASVTVQGRSGEGTEELVDALTALGIRVSDDGDFTILVLSDYLQERAVEASRRHLAGGRPWMLLKPVGQRIWVGPILVPGSTACYECLRFRLMENRWMDVPFWLRGEALPLVPQMMIATTPAMAAALAAAEVARWLVCGSGPTVGAIYTFDTIGLEPARHSVSLVPGCPACSAKATPPVGPDQLEERLSKYVSPITGLFHDLEELRLAPGAPVHLCSVRYTMPLPVSRPNQAMRPPAAVGRGYTLSGARLSCLAEAVERRSLFFRGDEPRTRMSYVEAGARALDPDSLLLFSPAQYCDRVEINRRLPSYFQIPQRWAPEQEMDWVPAREVLGGEFRLAPAALCYLGHPEPLLEGVDSNGCAAGSTRQQAILHGLYELVEREAAAIWWYNRVPRPAIDLRSVDDPQLWLVERYFRRRGETFHLLDLTTDWGIPTVAAVCHDLDGTRVRFAFGAHPDPKRAAGQAATELFQIALAHAGENSRAFFVPDSANVEDYPYLLPHGTVEAAPAQELSDEERLASCAERARELGLELIWVDMTRQDTGLPVVRVMVPEMRPRTPRLAPGRLFDVPVKLGWLERRLGEQELNPIALV